MYHLTIDIPAVSGGTKPGKSPQMLQPITEPTYYYNPPWVHNVDTQTHMHGHDIGQLFKQELRNLNDLLTIV